MKGLCEARAKPCSVLKKSDDFFCMQSDGPPPMRFSIRLTFGQMDPTPPPQDWT